ncbi:disease resistance-like protein DSC1 [Populus trichocarpa]|uniref:disease resistance-like protein DSC1 n=1 Tax=Populus trichocarpa TaxID=3694 RepID=UPI0022797C95|nr:disease resistance-like protein DSC1 [Populus trichocarpa]
MASSSSPTTPYLKLDVFLSFRGTDTRNSFTSHLHDALQRNQIDAYIDNKLDGGEKIEPALLERIEESFISLVIFSENYADSTFCLRELSKILECMETKQQMVLPVFYRLVLVGETTNGGSDTNLLVGETTSCGSDTNCWGFLLPLRNGGVHDHCSKEAKHTDTIFNVVRQIAYIHGRDRYY